MASETLCWLWSGAPHMGAFMIWKWSMAIDLPAHMVAMHTTFPCLYVCTAGSNIELHANGLVLVLSKLDSASIGNLDATLAFFPLALASALALSFLISSGRAVLRIRLKALA